MTVGLTESGIDRAAFVLGILCFPPEWRRRCRGIKEISVPWLHFAPTGSFRKRTALAKPQVFLFYITVISRAEVPSACLPVRPKVSDSPALGGTQFSVHPEASSIQ